MTTSSGSGGSGVRVHGLDELNRALRRLEDEAPRELHEGDKEVADEVADKAKGAGFALGGVAAKTAPTVHATDGRVGFGGEPYAAGAEFGGRGRPTTQQFKPWRGSGAGAGYFVYPTVRSVEDDLDERYLDKINDLCERLGLK